MCLHSVTLRMPISKCDNVFTYNYSATTHFCMWPCVYCLLMYVFIQYYSRTVCPFMHVLLSITLALAINVCFSQYYFGIAHWCTFYSAILWPWPLMYVLLSITVGCPFMHVLLSITLAMAINVCFTQHYSGIAHWCMFYSALLWHCPLMYVLLNITLALSFNVRFTQYYSDTVF